jgi:hypothetical protein
MKPKTLPLWNAALLVASTVLTGLLVVYVALLIVRGYPDRKSRQRLGAHECANHEATSHLMAVAPLAVHDR